jgi:hypothetical protein
MTIKAALQEYVSKKTTALQLIGSMTGMFNPDMAIDILALINQITRVESGDMDLQIFKDMYELE